MYKKRLLLSLVFSALLLISFVGATSHDLGPVGPPAPGSVSATVAQDLFGSIRSFFVGITGSTFQSVGFAQFLLFVLVALIVYSISPFLPFIGDKNWVSIAISIVVALLATLYLKSEEIYTILLSYGALGIVLTGIIPFFAIAVVASKSHEKGHPIFAKIIWIAFFLVTFARWLTANPAEIGNFGKYVYPIVLVLSVIMFFWENRLRLIMFKREVSDFKDQFRMEQVAERTSELERMNRQIESTSDPAVRNTLVIKYNKKAKDLRALGVNWRDYG
ncbi:MAG: hypothetical protein AABW79_00950 [Nanoarchaeota archaeon]